MRIRRIAVVAAALVLAGLVSITPETGTLAAPTNALVITRTVTFEPSNPRETPREAPPDAELIGKVLGGSAAAGSAWQDAQAAMSTFVEDLADAAGDRLVGQFVPRSLTYSVVVRVTSGEPIAALEDLARRLVDEVGVPITLQYVDAPAYSTLISELDRVSSALALRGYRVLSRIDDTTSQIVLIPELGVTTKTQVEAVASTVLGSTPFRVEDPQPGQVPMLTGGLA